MPHDDKTSRIRALNDAFRTTLQGGKVMLTAGVSDLAPPVIASLIERLRSYDEFSEDNDPNGEHDFGVFDLVGQRFFWKIDYYDVELRYGSDDPADPLTTVRVLTLMRADEY